MCKELIFLFQIEAGEGVETAINQMKQEKVRFSLITKLQKNENVGSGADQEFLERGFICIKVWEGFRLLILSHIFFNIP